MHSEGPSPHCKSQVGLSWGESGLEELRARRGCTLSKQHLLSKVIGSDLEGTVKGSVDPRGLRKLYEMAECLLPGSGGENVGSLLSEFWGSLMAGCSDLG